MNKCTLRGMLVFVADYEHDPKAVDLELTFAS
ncbi:hypothetical protein ES703_07309 [subsurface metagenome]